MDRDGLILKIKIRQLDEGLNLAGMADKLGVSPGTLSRVYNGKRIPGRKFLSGILRAYPDLQEDIALFLSRPRP